MNTLVTVVNTTTHPVNIVNGDNAVVTTYPASGVTIRLSSNTVEVGVLPDGTRITTTVYGQPVLMRGGEVISNGLPEPQNDVYYIVSALVKNACPDRQDLLVPAEMVRDANNQIIGCKSLGV